MPYYCVAISKIRYHLMVVDIFMSNILFYRSQTYYDQVVICGWCIDSFMEMFKDFFNCNALILPTSECLEILCSMMENCQNYQGIVTLTLEVWFMVLCNIKIFYLYKSVAYSTIDIFGTSIGNLSQ